MLTEATARCPLGWTRQTGRRGRRTASSRAGPAGSACLACSTRSTVSLLLKAAYCSARQTIYTGLIRPWLALASVRLTRACARALTSGRCDVWFEFTHADSEQVVAAFKHFYLPAPRTAEREARTADAPDPEADKARLERERQIDELARLFAYKVEKELLTIAQLQGFFLRYRNKPVEVVEAVDAWIASGFEQGAARIVPADPRLAVAPLQAITSRAQSQAGEPIDRTRGEEEDEPEGGVSDEAEGGGEDAENSDEDGEIEDEDEEA